MSGMPLPVPDVPVGTVTARVIRGALTNPVPGIEVELLGAEKKAKTDDAGRATFSGLAPGSPPPGSPPAPAPSVPGSVNA